MVGFRDLVGTDFAPVSNKTAVKEFGSKVIIDNIFIERLGLSETKGILFFHSNDWYRLHISHLCLKL